jgi:hypothetical protein
MRQTLLPRPQTPPNRAQSQRSHGQPTDLVALAVPCGVARRTAWFLKVTVATMLAFLAITVADVGHHSPPKFHHWPEVLQ